MPKLKDATCLSITFLTPVSIGSLNGSDKEADNVSSIKKLTRGTDTYPYVSSQALRRALRDQLGVLGHELSEGQKSDTKKGAAITQCLPKQFIDDDLFGFMYAEKNHKRTSPVRVSPLLALDRYEGDLDFGTNYMARDKQGNPNIFETEIHGGLYRGTVLVELDTVGRSRTGEGEGPEKNQLQKAWELNSAQRSERVLALLSALQHLWSSGRQSRFLSDISPKFVAAAVTTAKTPVFLESVCRTRQGLDLAMISEALADAKHVLAEHCFGSRSGLFNEVPEGCLTVGEAFDRIRSWVRDYYGS
jgi:CRISPR-associated protein Cst2